MFSLSSSAPLLITLTKLSVEQHINCAVHIDSSSLLPQAMWFNLVSLWAALHIPSAWCLWLCIWQLRLRGTNRHQATEPPLSESHDNSTSRHAWGVCLSPLTDSMENLALSPLSSHFSFKKNFFNFFFFCVVCVVVSFFCFLNTWLLPGETRSNRQLLVKSVEIPHLKYI